MAARWVETGQFVSGVALVKNEVDVLSAAVVVRGGARAGATTNDGWAVKFSLTKCNARQCKREYLTYIRTHKATTLPAVVQSAMHGS